MVYTKAESAAIFIFHPGARTAAFIGDLYGFI